jgi:hypothetical protein
MYRYCAVSAAVEHGNATNAKQASANMNAVAGQSFAVSGLIQCPTIVNELPALAAALKITYESYKSPGSRAAAIGTQGPTALAWRKVGLAAAVWPFPVRPELEADKGTEEVDCLPPDGAHVRVRQVAKDLAAAC